MRWHHRTPIRGEQRSASGFLFVPMTIAGETRWLEFAQWVEQWDWHEEPLMRWRRMWWNDPEERA